MSIIKCPECGHQVSDQAPVCPTCGVKISGNIIRCPQCGEIYLKNQPECPHCHHANMTSSQAKAPVTPPTAPKEKPTMPKGGSDSIPPTNNTPKKKGHGVLIASFIIAIIAVGVIYFLYNNAQNNKEQEAYDYAMSSNDPMVLQSFLDTYKDAEEAHRDSIQTRLTSLKQVNMDWTNAVMSGSKTALQAYLDKYKDSPHKIEALHKIDSIDWATAENANTQEAIQSYLDEHVGGEHVDEANNALKDLIAKTVQPQEKSAVVNVLRKFFQCINSKNENGLTNTVATFLTTFLGKTDATSSDVVTFMHKIYKEDVANMNWHLNGDYKIDKKEVGDNEFEYNVLFSATQDVDYKNATVSKYKYRITATVDSNGKISAMNMTKIIE